MWASAQRYGWGLSLLVCCLSAYIAWLSVNSAKLAAQHEHTLAAQLAAVHADTVRLRQLDTVAVARGSLQRVRDTLLTHLTDTVLVKQFIAHVDTVLAADSVAIARANTFIHSLAQVIAAKDSELAIATLPRAEGRLHYTAEATWEPYPGVRAVSGSVQYTIAGPVRLLLRGEQRALAEAPRVGLGISLAF